jgi:hypothetical protein
MRVRSGVRGGVMAMHECVAKVVHCFRVVNVIVIIRLVPVTGKQNVTFTVLGQVSGAFRMLVLPVAKLGHIKTEDYLIAALGACVVLQNFSCVCVASQIPIGTTKNECLRLIIGDRVHALISFGKGIGVHLELPKSWVVEAPVVRCFGVSGGQPRLHTNEVGERSYHSNTPQLLGIPFRPLGQPHTKESFMDTIISLSRRVSAFRTAAGVFYALFETTHPKGQAKPSPRTDCVAFGTLAHVTQWIFRAMAACDAGLIQTANGRIEPVDYWRYWQFALSRPDALFTQPIWIKASMASDATVPMQSSYWHSGNRLPFVVRMMQKHGYYTLAMRLQAGEEIILDLHRDATVLADIYSGVKNTRIQPCQIIQPHGAGEGDPSLAPPERPKARSTNRPRIYDIGHPTRLVTIIPGFGSMIGTKDELMFEFIERIACDWEQKAATAGIHGMATFRDALERPPIPAPASLHVVIDKAVLAPMVLYADMYRRIEEGLGRRGRAIESGLNVSVGSLREARLLDLVAGLPCTSLQFVPLKEPAPAPLEALAA